MKKFFVIFGALCAFPLLLFGMRLVWNDHTLQKTAQPPKTTTAVVTQTAASANRSVQEQVLSYHNNDLHVFKPVDIQCSVVIVSGFEGWTGEVVDIARRISAENSCLVSGLDLKQYLKNLDDLDPRRFCPAADLNHLDVYVQKTLGTKKYMPPLLVGYGEGSTVTYVALAQIPICFLGGFSFGFCPDFVEMKQPCQEPSLTSKHLKDNPGHISYFAFDGMDVPFSVLSWRQPKSCSVDDIGAYLANVPHASYIQPQKDWMPQFKSALATGEKSLPTPPTISTVADLPLIENPSDGHSDTMFLILSGDGGWVDLARFLGDFFHDKKYAVVGFDTLQYYWHYQKPARSGKDLGRIINAYLSQWKKKKIIVMGYSFGADVIPIMLRHLNDETRKAIESVVLIGPNTKTDLEFQVSYLERDAELTTGEPLFPMFRHFTDTKILCIGGIIEKESLCKRIREAAPEMKNVDIDMIDTGHMFGSNPDKLGQKIVDKLNLH
jgi:type IV secretory pathway VirJ component